MAMVDGVTLSITSSEKSLPIALAPSPGCQAGQPPLCPLTSAVSQGANRVAQWESLEDLLHCQQGQHQQQGAATNKFFSISDKDEWDKFLP